MAGITPFVGSLGAFGTGSAMASNILVADLQVGASRAAGVTPFVTLGAQGFGAATGNIIAPFYLLAGATTLGLVGREDEILRRTFAAWLVFTLAGGLLVCVFP